VPDDFRLPFDSTGFSVHGKDVLSHALNILQVTRQWTGYSPDLRRYFGAGTNPHIWNGGLSVFEFDIEISSAVALDTSAGVKPSPFSADLLDKMHRYWCAANYLTIGQIYSKDNALLREP
jgi:hypothetical protein